MENQSHEPLGAGPRATSPTIPYVEQRSKTKRLAMMIFGVLLVLLGLLVPLGMVVDTSGHLTTLSMSDLALTIVLSSYLLVPGIFLLKTRNEDKVLDRYVNAQGSVEDVKRGFSLPAFFFSPLWALLHGLWGIGLALILYNVGVLLLSDEIAYTYEQPVVWLVVAVVGIVLPLVVGFRGNSWRRSRLTRRGYEMRDMTPGEGLGFEEALWARREWPDKLREVMETDPDEGRRDAAERELRGRGLL